MINTIGWIITINTLILCITVYRICDCKYTTLAETEQLRIRRMYAPSEEWSETESEES